jgi:hypothetical protein
VRPARFFVRIWTPDPTEEGPDSERDSDEATERGARERAKQLREIGLRAGAFERRNVRYPEEIPPGLDLPPYLWDCDVVQLDEDEP